MVLVIIGSAEPVILARVFSRVVEPGVELNVANVFSNGFVEIRKAKTAGDILPGGHTATLVGRHIAYAIALASHGPVDIIIGFDSVKNKAHVSRVAGLPATIDSRLLVVAFARRMVETYHVSLGRLASHVASKLEGGLVAVEHALTKPKGRRVRAFYGSSEGACIIYGGGFAVIGPHGIGGSCRNEGVLFEASMVGRVVRLKVYDLSKALRTL